MMMLNSAIYLLILYLLDLSISDRGVVKFPIMTVNLSLFKALHFCQFLLHAFSCYIVTHIHVKYARSCW